MAFENPLLRPSNTRQAALRYLWSDEPESESVPQQQSIVDNAFGLTESTDIAGNVAGNIANNGGEYNPDDNSDYGAWAKANPIEAAKALQENKGVIKGILSVMGIPMASSIIAAAEQNAANNVLGLVNGFVSQYGGKVVEGGSLITAAGKAALPFGIGKLMSSDSVEASNALVTAFNTTDAMSGYFGAALDPTVGQIVDGMIEDPTTITAAQYGTIGQAVRSRIQNSVESGMPLNTAQNEAIDFFQPQAAVSTPITGEVTSGTSFQPANPDGSFVNPGLDSNTTGTGVVVGGPIDSSLPSTTDLGLLGGSSGGYSGPGGVDGSGVSAGGGNAAAGYGFGGW